MPSRQEFSCLPSSCS